MCKTSTCAGSLSSIYHWICYLLVKAVRTSAQSTIEAVESRLLEVVEMQHKMWIYVTLEDCPRICQLTLIYLWGSSVSLRKPNEASCLTHSARSSSRSFSLRCLTETAPAAGEERGLGELGRDGSWGFGRCAGVASENIALMCSLLEYIKWTLKERLNSTEGWVFNGTLCHREAFVASVNFVFHRATPAHIYLHLLFAASCLRDGTVCPFRTLAGQTAGLFSILPAKLGLFHNHSHFTTLLSPKLIQEQHVKAVLIYGNTCSPTAAHR